MLDVVGDESDEERSCCLRPIANFLYTQILSTLRDVFGRLFFTSHDHAHMSQSTRDATLQSLATP